MTILFSEGFETGDLTNFTSTTITAGATLTGGDTTNPHHGTYNLKSTMPTGLSAGSWACANKSGFDGNSTLYIRAMNVKFDQLPEDNTDNHYFFGCFQAASSNAIVRCGCNNSGGTIRWLVRGISSGTTFTNYTGTNTPEINTNYTLELQVTLGSGTGIFRLYVNGSLEVEVTGVDNDSRALNYIQFGNCGSTQPDLNALNVYMDCIDVADVYLGPEAVGQQLFTLINEMGY